MSGCETFQQFSTFDVETGSVEILNVSGVTPQPRIKMSMTYVPRRNRFECPFYLISSFMMYGGQLEPNGCSDQVPLSELWEFSLSKYII